MTLSRRPDFYRAVRTRRNHHLWKNGPHQWWIAYSASPTPVTMVRIRHSLKTCDVVEARRKRDAIFASLP